MTAQVRTLCTERLQGGWAVCLRRWDGHHVVTKDLGRARIDALAQGADILTDAWRLKLFNAVERLDAVALPFAPYERPHGTPGKFIDATRKRYRLWL